jgi:EAL domain-containing protein (putative c-di-GMP-specific phosphodiesterase class I)
VRIADAALHEAKANGGNTFRTGSADANDPALRRLELEADLHRAVEQGDLVLHYQPQVDPATGRIRALEALLRWNHPVHGAVSPNEFIPLLEETGLIVEVGDFVLRAACVQARAWRDAGHDDLRIAVNLSPRQFLVSDLDDRIRAALEFADLPPAALEVELTETAGLLDLDSVSGVLNALIDLGVTTAIDDFGIGQSWLGRLQQFSIRTLKVDRSFIHRMEASSSDLAIVQAVVALGHALGMTVVAEGVETSEQLDVVRAIGCDLVQGYFYAPALEPGAVMGALIDGYENLTQAA